MKPEYIGVDSGNHDFTVGDIVYVKAVMHVPPIWKFWKRKQRRIALEWNKGGPTVVVKSVTTSALNLDPE